MDINCPGCGHGINDHHDDSCCRHCDRIDASAMCRKTPADIARALLTAEPTDAEVEAASAELGIPWRSYEQDARAAIASAMKVRAGQ